MNDGIVFGLDCKDCKIRKRDPFDNLDGLCVLCKYGGILRRMLQISDLRIWLK